jgi:hypothetical protein
MGDHVDPAARMDAARAKLAMQALTSGPWMATGSDMKDLTAKVRRIRSGASHARTRDPRTEFGH